ncbi:MAG: LpxL/LpxP family Kdo(2)-lipid IV(A) lauroyl/palmitoleoyl acyltransferase [gamma proteobacterium symbiont of Taylorina sp.]|nr:LpxL/LpxP family Kdo(2)-lipid IV(A) lauroyl/palmitoleoyl acyltransferase [gamma proteobacterium symbiont of Taylorina sp.]
MTAQQPFLWYNYLAPKYWPSWLGLGAMRIAVILPYRIQLMFGFSIGHLFYLLGKYRRKVVQTNIQLCFPELSAQQQEQLVKKHFHSVGMGLIEIAMNWWGQADQLKKLVTIKNYHYIEEALKRGQGIIVLGAHYTTVELSARFITLDNKFAASYQSMRNPIFDHYTMQARYRNFDQVFARDEIRQTFRYIKQANVVWIAADQDTGIDNSEFVPFFGQLAATQTVASRMAKITKAAIIPYYSRRLKGTQGYVMEFFPPLENFPGNSLKEDAVRTNQILEEFIRQAPEQYLWTHRRFKTRPEGEAKLYSKKPRRVNRNKSTQK